MMWAGLAACFAHLGYPTTLYARNAVRCGQRAGCNGVDFHPGARFSRSLFQNLIVDALYTLRTQASLGYSQSLLLTNTVSWPIFASHRRDVVTMVCMQRMPKGQLSAYTTKPFIVAPSDAVCERIRSYEPELHSAVIPNPVLTTTFFATGEARRQSALFAGRLHPEKGLELLVDAMSALASTGCDWELWLAGPVDAASGGGGRSFLDKLLTRCRSRCIVYGPVRDRETLAALYRSCGVFVYPSIADAGETFGVAPLEAMACGAPTIVSDLDCFKDYAHDEQNVLTFRRADGSAGLAKQLRRLMECSRLRSRLGAQSATDALAYSYPAVATQYLALFAALQEWTHHETSPLLT